MNVEQNGDQTYSPTPPDNTAHPAPPPPQPRRRSGWRIFWTIVLVMSIMVNIFLLFSLFTLGVLVAAGSGGLLAGTETYVEQTLVEGSATDKIVVIGIEGIIDSASSRQVKNRLKVAADDPRVKAVILRVVTPGGTVSASDQIHYEITKFKNSTGKPVVSFMQSIAASGGYYSSVACDSIIAEPTAITGSIGVILNSMSIEELLEDKLGIQPVVIKSGPKKDWPSMFSKTTDEQKDYLSEKLIMPAYERFVDLVTEGRGQKLTRQQVEELADGSIYGAAEAMNNGLIDKVGYMDQAIELAESMASISGARVVEYQKPFSVYSFLGARAKTPWSFDRNTLEQMAVPRLMYLWDAR